ncbi:hypothetical protein GCM10023108_46700 [Saccharopolyspora hordei]
MGSPSLSVTVDTCGMSCRASDPDILDMASAVWLTIAPAPVAMGSSNAATSTPAKTHNPNIFNSTPLRTPAPIIKCHPARATIAGWNTQNPSHRPAGGNPVDIRLSGTSRHLLLFAASPFR